MKIRVTDSKRFDPHCAYCKDDFALDDRDVDACPECETHLHEDCWREAKGCPTVGCAWKPAGAKPAPSRAPLERVPRRPRVRCYRCSELLGEGPETCSGCGWSFHTDCYDGRTCCATAGNLPYPTCARCGGRFLTRSRHTCQHCESVLHTSCSTHHRCEEDAAELDGPNVVILGGIAALVLLVLILCIFGALGF